MQKLITKGAAMISDPFDFNVFQSRVLLSQQRHAPLQENLRDLMASVLGKVMDYSGASLAAHLFVNLSFDEGHLMVLRRGTAEWEAVGDLALHREGVVGTVDPSRLPEYCPIRISRSSQFFVLLNAASDPYLAAPPRELMNELGALHVPEPEAGEERDSAAAASLAVVPLARGRFGRLGAFLLWSHDEGRTKAMVENRQMEALVELAHGVSRLVVRVFSGLYGMQPFTYLPSYYRPERKNVGLLCAQVRHFDYIARTLELRKDMNDGERRACLRKLVNSFSETVADVVESYHGRIDQLWGGGLLAVFGEYVDSSGDAKVSACLRVIQAAAEAVRRFDQAKRRWLEEDFGIAKFRQISSHHVTTDLAVAVSFGEVEFDYLGSRDHRIFMSFGDQVSLVKQLVSRACRTELDPDGERLSAPILATQQVFVLARSCIRDSPPNPVGSVEQNTIVKISGRPEVIPVFKLWPGNVTTTSG